MRVTAFKLITPRTVSKFENSDLWYLPSLCTSLYDIFINWERTSLAYDKVQMTKARLTLSPGSRVMLVPIPLVMRGVPAQIFFAVPGDKIWDVRLFGILFNSRSTILCKSNLSLISLQAVVRWSKRQSAASGQKGLIRTQLLYSATSDFHLD